MQVPVLDGNTMIIEDRAVSLRPPAKLNLSLVVSQPRSDGYHDIHTIMATVGLHDDLRISVSDRVQVSLFCSGVSSPAGKDNLVYQAAETLARHAGLKPAVNIHLHKRIPPGAGLGGASSDAAACLMGLNHLWKLNYSQSELAGIAAELGSDIPFFLYGPVAVCTGRGEIVKSIEHRCRRSILLVMPNIEVPTPEIYRHYHCDEKQHDDYMRRVNYFLRYGDLDGLIIQRINSLEQTCLERFSQLNELRRQLESMEIGPLQISGSGSCMFATAGSKTMTSKWARQINQSNLARAQSVTFYNQPEPFLEVHHADI